MLAYLHLYSESQLRVMYKKGTSGPIRCNKVAFFLASEIIPGAPRKYSKLFFHFANRSETEVGSPCDLSRATAGSCI